MPIAKASAPVSAATVASCSLCEPGSDIPHESKILRLRIANLCCSGEEKIILDVLNKMKGISEVSVNIIARSAVVKHCPIPCCSPIESIITNLNKEKLGASVHESLDDDDVLTENVISLISGVHAAITSSLFVLSLLYSEISSNKALCNEFFILCALVGIIPIVKFAFEALARRKIDVNLLIIVAMTGSISGNQARDGALVVTLFILSKFLEEIILHHVRGAIRLSTSSVGRYAILLDGKSEKKVLVDDLKVCDFIAVRTGDMIPVDGRVVAGQASVNESAITGEAEFINKAPGSKVMSGSIVQNGFIEVEVLSVAKESLIRKINDAVNDVQARKGSMASIVDSFAGYWVPAVVGGAVLVIAVGGWITGNWREFLNKGLVLMVLACPCSIVLAAPVATLSGIAYAAKNGVIIKGSDIMETLGLIDVIAVDKTGTLTHGSFTVTGRERFRTDKEDDEDASDSDLDPARMAAAVESKSSHPLANAVMSGYVTCIAEMKEEFLETKKIQIVDGVGINGWVKAPSTEWVYVAVGNERLFKGGLNNSSAPKGTASGKCVFKKGQLERVKKFIEKWPVSTHVFVTIEDELALCYALGDSTRSESREAVRQLLKNNYRVMMLTGDSVAVAEAASKELNVTEVKARLRPDEKCQCVESLERNGKRVLMLGDGINDTTALAAASVGVAMGAAGAAMAVNTADVVLMSENLLRIPQTLDLAKFTRRIIFQNVCFSLCVKLIAIILAFFGFIILWNAIIIDMGCLVAVALNGIRPLNLQIFNDQKNGKEQGSGTVDVDSSVTDASFAEDDVERQALLSSSAAPLVDGNNREYGSTK